ncbi:hypothetical protein L208DRAFT_1405146 [Tricholoma matsutake]|nr:hypothetical protein L208DRAFT_1405146 [Tricholoma matsutake 945]
MSHSGFPQSLPITSSMDIEDGHSTVTLSRELIYHIIGYLRGYPETMKACALTCKEWLPIVRIHFYHSIRFNHDALGKADRVARRFCELLDREPDFAQLIRELSIHWSAMFASSLIQRVDFTRLTSLEKVSLNFIPWSQAPLQTIRTIQLLFTLPSLTNLVLYSHVFKNITQFATLFDECRLNLKTLTLDHIAFIEAENLEACMQNFDNIHRPRVQLQSLELLHGSLGCIIPWLLHAHSPIDLSTLESLSCVDGGQNIPMLRKLFGAVGSVLKFLEIRSPSSKCQPAAFKVRMLILVCRTHRR